MPRQLTKIHGFSAGACFCLGGPPNWMRACFMRKYCVCFRHRWSVMALEHPQHCRISEKDRERQPKLSHCGCAVVSHLLGQEAWSGLIWNTNYPSRLPSTTTPVSEGAGRARHPNRGSLQSTAHQVEDTSGDSCLLYDTSDSYVCVWHSGLICLALSYLVCPTRPMLS